MANQSFKRAKAGLARLEAKLLLPKPLMLRAWAGALPGFFNATFLTLDADTIILICRQSYYRLTKIGFMATPVNFDRTRNFLALFQRGHGGMVLQRLIHQRDLNLIEDIRVYTTPAANFCFAVRLVPPNEPSESGPKRKSVPIAGTLTRSGDQLTIKSMQIPGEIQPVEKNWVYFERDGALWIERFPGMSDLYRVDQTALTMRFETTGTAVFDWSGTKSVVWAGGNLFLDHKRIKVFGASGAIFRYIYRFRHIAGGQTRTSEPFSIGRRADVNYVSDIQREPGTSNLLWAVSKNDNEFALFSTDEATVTGLLNTGDSTLFRNTTRNL